MKTDKQRSLYRTLSDSVREKVCDPGQHKIDIGETIRAFRMAQGLTGALLCRRAGDLDPRTLTAVEKGRIKNPSIKTLQSVARALGVTVSQLFRQQEADCRENFYLGSQKGTFHIDFPQKGVKIISFTPFIRDFFCGKMILAPHVKVEDTLLEHEAPLFISALIGRIEVTVEGKKCAVKEGENLFFNGILKHSFYNPMHRESAFLMVMAPSFL